MITQSDLFGQHLPDNARVKWGNEMHFTKKMTPSEVVASDQSGYYLMKEGYAQESRHSQTLLYLEKFDRDLQYVKSVDLSHQNLPGNPRFIQLVSWGQQLWLFYTADPKNNGAVGLYRVAVDSESLLPAGISHLVMEINSQAANIGWGITGTATLPLFQFYTVPEKNKLLIIQADGGLKTRENQVDLLVVDQQFCTIWKREATIKSSSDALEIVHALLDSEGNAHLLSKSMPNRIGLAALFKREKYYYSLHSITDNGIHLLHKEINLKEAQINAAAIQVDQEGHLYFGGFYTTDATATKGSGGTYFLKLVGTTQAVIQQKMESFDATFLTRGLSEGRAKRKSRKLDQGKKVEDSYFFLDRIFVRNDGSVTFVGEDRQGIGTSSRSKSANSRVRSEVNFHCYYGSIVLVDFSPNGERKWAEKIAKHQQSSNDFGGYFSYSVSMINDNLYFVFNDNVNNSGYNGGKVERFSPRGFKEHMMTFARVNRAGTIERSSFATKHNRNMMTITSVNTQTDDYEMVVYGQHKKKYRLARLEFDPKVLAAE